MLGGSESRVTSTVNMITFTPSMFRRGKNNPIQSCRVGHFKMNGEQELSGIMVQGNVAPGEENLWKHLGWIFGTNNQTLLSRGTSLSEGKTTEAVCFY